MTTKQELIADIKRVAALLGGGPLSRSEYMQHGRFSAYQIYDGGDTWESLCQEAGITTRKVAPVSDDIYFERLRRAVAELGRLPKTAERKRFRLNFSKRRYPTLNEFIDAAIAIGVIDSAFKPSEPAPQDAQPKIAAEKMPLPIQPSRARSVPPIPTHTHRRNWKRTGIEGFPYAPQDELGVVALFGILCASGVLDWSIIELSGGKGIDAKCFDHANHQEIVVELKYLLSRSSWNHRIEGIDYVVCWENRWKDFPKPVIELSTILSQAL